MCLIIYCKIKFTAKEWFGKSSRKCYGVNQPVGHSSFLQSNNPPLDSHSILLGITIQSMITQFFCHACVCVQTQEFRLCSLATTLIRTNHGLLRTDFSWARLCPCSLCFRSGQGKYGGTVFHASLFFGPNALTRYQPGGCGLYRRLPPPTKIKWNLYI